MPQLQATQSVPSRPVVLGYQRVRLGVSDADVHAGLRALEGFADRAGLRLLRVYMDADANRPCGELVRLIRAVRETGAEAVAVPTRADLGGTPFVQCTTAAMIEREAHARVVVVEDTTPNDDAVRGGSR